MLGACWALGLTPELRSEFEWVRITVGCTWSRLTCVCVSAYQNVAMRLCRRGCMDSDLHNKVKERALVRGQEEAGGSGKSPLDALAKHDQRDTYGSAEVEPDALRCPSET